jgi:hypothetical protein
MASEAGRWHPQHLAHGVDAHELGGLVASVEFPNQEILHKIAVSNQSLRDGARVLDAAYSIELVQDCLSNNRMQAVFELRLVRTAQVAQALAGRHASVGGGVQLVCRYTLYFGRDERAKHQFDHILSKSVLESFATVEAAHDKKGDESKEHARLLVHLMLFCVASARKRVSVRSIDPGIVSVFRDYDTFSHFDYHGWEIDNHEMDIEVVEDEKLENESRCIDASRSLVNPEHFMKLEDQEIEDLKSQASLHVIKCIRNMTQSVPVGHKFSDFFV